MTSISDPIPLPESVSTEDDLNELTPTRYAMERGLLVIGERTELILVRHAQQIRTMAAARRQGGPGLSELGQAQARLTGQYLAADADATAPISAVYCSDLNRTVETAGIIASAAAPGLTPQPTPALREIDMYGRASGDADVSPETQATAGQKFGRTLRWDAFPNTEAGADFRQRIHAAVREIAEKHPNERVLVVSHAGAISAFVAELIGAEPDMFYFPGHASVNRVFHGDDRFIPQSMNEVGHLRARGALTF
ncbi:histidine phosphatase family protein [Nocardia alni]|uniref:histidine phosphatase family protein n=1 Tax=Nocardia alni TaxID=2815723 RepID=UPI001C24DD7E|nr:histidine phosphatase family protein [Nocardia alni]